jgi:hypothetical protein
MGNMGVITPLTEHSLPVHLGKILSINVEWSLLESSEDVSANRSIS